MRYFAFFSYSRADAKLARKLHRFLDGYKIPKSLASELNEKLADIRKLHPIFKDQSDLDSGGDLTSKLSKALDESRFLIVLCTRASAQSQWVNREVEHFLQAGRENQIFPVIGDGEPNSSDADNECLPKALRDQNLLAADLRDIKLRNGRQVGDGFDVGRLKLISGMLGFPLDALIKREQKRRRTLITRLVTASLVFCAVSVVAVFQSISAYVAQQEAILSADEAEAARKAQSIAVEQTIASIPPTLQSAAQGELATGNAKAALEYLLTGLEVPGNKAVAKAMLASELRRMPTVHAWLPEESRISGDGNTIASYSNGEFIIRSNGSEIAAKIEAPWIDQERSDLRDFQLSPTGDEIVVWGRSDRFYTLRIPSASWTIGDTVDQATDDYLDDFPEHIDGLYMRGHLWVSTRRFSVDWHRRRVYLTTLDFHFHSMTEKYAKLNTYSLNTLNLLRTEPLTSITKKPKYPTPIGAGNGEFYISDETGTFLFDPATGKRSAVLPAPFREIRENYDADMLALASGGIADGDPPFNVLTTNPGLFISGDSATDFYSLQNEASAWSGFGVLESVSEDSKLQVRRANCCSGSALIEIPKRNEEIVLPPGSTSIDVSPEADLLAVAAVRGAISIYDVKNLDLKLRIAPLGQEIIAMTFGNDPSRLIALLQQSVVIIDPISGTVVERIEHTSGRMNLGHTTLAGMTNYLGFTCMGGQLKITVGMLNEPARTVGLRGIASDAYRCRGKGEMSLADAKRLSLRADWSISVDKQPQLRMRRHREWISIDRAIDLSDADAAEALLSRDATMAVIRYTDGTLRVERLGEMHLPEDELRYNACQLIEVLRQTNDQAQFPLTARNLLSAAEIRLGQICPPSSRVRLE